MQRSHTFALHSSHTTKGNQLSKAKLLSVPATIVLVGATIGAPLASATTVEAPQHDVTSSVEAQRVDNVDVSNVKWEQCFDFEDVDFPDDPFFDFLKTAQCAQLVVPMDYDKPEGEQYTVELMKQPAKNADAKTGSLFVNPGGPSGSAWSTALTSSFFLSEDVTSNFDVIGVEPRGMGMNVNAQCFPGYEKQEDVLMRLFEASYPEKAGDYAKFLTASREVGKGCANQTTLQQHMSTAEVVRDMDVARRAVGDEKLTYLGFSYGTAIGQYYANMFPERVRAIVNDGVVDATDWTGNAGNGQKLLEARLGSAVSADAAFQEVLRACDEAGPKYCYAAATEESPLTAAQKWEEVFETLKKGPIEYTYTWEEYDEEGNLIDSGTETELIGLKEMQNFMLGDLYSTYYAAEFVAETVSILHMLANGEDPWSEEEVVAAGTKLHKKRKDFAAKVDALSSGPADAMKKFRERDDEDGEGDEEDWYDGTFDGYSAVICTDGHHPMLTPDHMRQADNQEKVAPVFGKAWGWSTVHCSRDTWSASDKLAYMGSFDKKTSAPIMFVGNQYDPATAQAQAEKAAARQPGAILITSKSWGHTAYGTSDCVTDAVDSYLLTGKIGESKQCTGDYVPFSEPIGEEERSMSAMDAKRRVPSYTGTSPAVPVGSTAIVTTMKPVK